jgi:hypothetical protein
MKCHGCHQPLGDVDPTLVCQHVALGVHEGHSAGFHYDEESQAERPAAWCSACELRQQQAGTDAPSAPGEDALPMCPACYHNARRSNGPWGAAFVMNPEKLLADCVHNVGTGPGRFPFWKRGGYLRPRRPRWTYTDDDIRPFYHRYQEALRQGRVTWGAVVQADAQLAEPGPHSHPGDVVFVTDPSIDVDLIELRQVARRVAAIKGSEPPDPRGSALSAYLAGELTSAFGLLVPDSVSPTMPCAISTVMFNRAHFPNGVLSRNVLPVLVTAGPHQVAVALPGSFWPERFRNFWAAG